jgi:hypothetical protein
LLTYWRSSANTVASACAFTAIADVRVCRVRAAKAAPSSIPLPTGNTCAGTDKQHPRSTSRRRRRGVRLRSACEMWSSACLGFESATDLCNRVQLPATASSRFAALPKFGESTGARNDYGYVVEGKGRGDDALGSIGLDGSGLGASMLGASLERRTAGCVMRAHLCARACVCGRVCARARVRPSFRLHFWLPACRRFPRAHACRYEPRHDVDSTFNRSANSTPDLNVRTPSTERDAHPHARARARSHTPSCAHPRPPTRARAHAHTRTHCYP